MNECLFSLHLAYILYQGYLKGRGVSEKNENKTQAESVVLVKILNH